MDQDKGNKKKKTVQKYNMNGVEDIWSTLLSDENLEEEDELFEGESLLYGDSYAEEVPEDDQMIDTFGESPEDVGLYAESFAGGAEEVEQPPEEAPPAAPGAEEFAAVLTFTEGRRQEIARVKLFHPQEDTILLIDEETNDELVISFAQLACIQVAGLPAGISASQREGSRKEIIETVDGNTHHVLVCPRQDRTGLVCCFAPQEQTGFPVILFPKASITKRSQDRQLSDILLEKRFISRTILQTAVLEFEQLKSLTFEKILAQRARVPLEEIEKALDNGKQNLMLGMQTGEILLISGLVNEEQILAAHEYHEQIADLELGQYLIDKGVVREVEVYVSLAELHRIPFVDLRQRKIPRESPALLPQSLIVKHEILPLVKKNDMLLVATHAVDISHLSEAIARAAGCKQVKYVLSPPTDIRKIIQLLCAK